MIVDVIIPVLNEENGITKVIRDVPASWVRNIVVVDNGSVDDSAKNATMLGAVVVFEPERGYGAACLAGMHWISKQELLPDVVCFLDGDYSDYPEQIIELVQPIKEGLADMVLASRNLGGAAKHSLTPQQRMGNWVATRMVYAFYGMRYTDLGPFRAIRYDALVGLRMTDRNYGWTAEMQVKAAKQRLRVREISAKYRPRIGVSKVSGTWRGALGAGYKIVVMIIKYV